MPAAQLPFARPFLGERTLVHRVFQKLLFQKLFQQLRFLGSNLKPLLPSIAALLRRHQVGWWCLVPSRAYVYEVKDEALQVVIPGGGRQPEQAMESCDNAGNVARYINDNCGRHEKARKSASSLGC